MQLFCLQTVSFGAIWPKVDEFNGIRGVTTCRTSKFGRLAAFSVSGDGNSSVDKTNVSFPNDYTELLEQVSLNIAASGMEY